ncbi:M1 family metallopeptidase [Novosphingobium lentum]|uniref:M1 family metallopeptidase n=1 Tax=Novosphingobium lentum TaxID=145287 RepID=UPI0008334DBE|nr:M1 family metallopeptidase [Novosphingobium lentum]
MRNLLLAATAFASTLIASPALAQTVTPPAEAGAVPLGRLSDAVVPSAYRLDLTVDPAKERFSGHAEVDAALKAPSRYVWLHGKDLKVSRVTATAGGKIWTGSFAQVDVTGVALATFPDALPAGPVKFAFDYDAPFNDGPSGMYRIKVGDDWYSWTQFESIDARAAFPGFDQPGFKTPFTVTLRTPAGLKAINNAPETGTDQDGAFTVHRFAPTLPLPTYLVAMMVGPFATLEGTVPATPQRATPLPIRVVSTKENADKLAFALDGTKGIVQHLEAYFGQPFPYPKLDQITSPVMPGAMENAGADLYADPILVMDDTASTSQKRVFGMVVAHELSHQWFGDLVTPAWWEDIWLNESFANWMGFRIGNEWRPDLTIGAGAVEEGFNAMGTDALLAGRPIHQKIDRNAQIDAAFDGITYGKGGQVVAMIAAYMGDTTFRDGVRKYMAAHKYGNATSGEFFAAMADAAGDARIIPAMQSFTDQQGVPLVTFSPAKGKPGQWTVTQSRYARLGTDAPQTRWGIPLCVRQAAMRQCQLMTGETATVTFAGKGPIMPNAGGTGYYRFELPPAQWDALIAGAATLPGSEAMALADSLIGSFYAGRATPMQVIAASRALVANPDSYAQDNATGLLEALAYRDVIDAPAKLAYARLMDRLFAPQLASLGFDPRSGAYAADTPEKSKRRATVVNRLASEAKDPALRAKLAAAAAAWLGGDANALDRAYYNPGFSSYVQAGKLPAAKALMDKALASQDPLFRPNALGAIGSSGDADTATWLLDGFKDDRLRASERLGLISDVITTSETREQGYQWMKRHLPELLGGSGGIFFASRLPGLLSGFCSAARADEMEQELRPKFAGKTGELELERTIERVRDCGVLKQARGAEFSKALVAVK